MFIRLAERLAGVGFDVIRFSFRGHGRSGGAQRGATIAGELLDLQAVVEFVAKEHSGKLSVVAASFGAVTTALSLQYVDPLLTGVVLWNPVLDLRRTFTTPELPWGIENFGPVQQDRLHRDGFLLIDGEFELGRVMWEELRCYQPIESFLQSKTPALVIHGDRDSSVSYDVARDVASRREVCEFHTVAGSDHGFDSREREDEAIDRTVEWLSRLHTATA